MLATLEQIAPDLIVLAGYMRILPRTVVEAFPRRIINIHPSLLPKYPGLNAPRQAIEAGEKETGCTVHYVDTGVDTGPIIAQARVPILAGDTPQSLHARIQAAEHTLLPQALPRL
ncbi:phosphoribosylglycinamide formyltransferase [Oscillatoria laete-virens NRMC-F 0139]|nr:phosphoribosylglycinamide formyltransferase [Oscillatoria laete-virens NRMC-F 0139]